MVEEITAEIKLLYNDDQVVKQAKQTSSSIGAMTKNVESGMKDISKSSDKAADDLGDLGNKGKASLNKVADGADNAAQSVKESALEVVALGETFAGVATTVFGFQEQILSLDRAMFGIKNTAIGLQDLIVDFKTAMQEGTLSTIDQARAIRDIQKEYANLTLEQEEAAAQQQALNGEFVAFGISLVQTVAITGIMLKQLGLTNIAMLKTRLSTIATSRAFRFLRFDLAGARIALSGVTLSFVGLRAGIRATFIALGPFGIAMIAIGAAFTLWETNAFGVQEKLKELFVIIQDMFPAIRLLTELASSIFPPTEEFDATADGFAKVSAAAAAGAGEFDILNTKTNDYTTAIQSMTFANIEAIDTMGIGGIGESNENTLTGAFNSVGEAASGASSELVLFGNLMFDATGNLVDISKRTDNTNIVFKKWQETLKGVNGELKMQVDLVDELKKNQTELNKSETSSTSLNGTTNFITRPGDQPDRRGNVTREFFESLSPELRGRFRPVSSVGLPTVIRDSIARRRDFRNSPEGIALQILGGGGGITQSQAQIASRNNIGFTTGPIREAIRHGLISFKNITNQLQSGVKLSVIRHQVITLLQQREEQIVSKRGESFGELSTILGTSPDDFTSRSESINFFAAQLAGSNLNISEAEARSRLGSIDSRTGGTIDYQTIINKRNALARELAYSNRQALLARIP